MKDIKPKNPFAKRKNFIQKTFECEITPQAKKNLWYFIKQELSYHNNLVEQLTPWLRTFPTEFLALKGNEKRIWNTAAEYELDIQKLYETPLDQWPDSISQQKEQLHAILYDNELKPKLTSRQIELMKIVSAPAKLPRLVRNLMASEMLRYMQSQAEVLDAALKTDVMRSPIQMLQLHTLETKRHLQMPASVILKLIYDENEKITKIQLPYCKDTLIVPNIDLTSVPYKFMILRAPHPQDLNGKWYIDLKDTNTYTVNLIDYDEKRRRR